MKIFFAFNHPAPYKVRTFNVLSKELDIFVVFERAKAKNRPLSFYNCNQYDFPHVFLKRGAFGDEQSNTGELKKYIKEHHNEYDIIVMNGYSTITEMRTIRYLIKHNIPYVLQINGGVIRKENKLKKKIKTYFISHAWKYMSPGDEADKYLINYGAKKEDIFHYPYSTLEAKDVLDAPISEEEKKKIKEEFHLPESPLYVTAAQFIERKNNAYLIKLFSKVKGNLVIAGEGKERPLYEQIIQENHLNNVELRAFLKKDQLYRLLQGCDYFVTLSKEDIYGHSILEALANGIPVISSDRVVSSRQIIKDGYNGYLVDIENEEQILSSFENIQKIVNTNCVESAKTYTIENSAKEIANILRGLKK